METPVIAPQPTSPPINVVRLEQRAKSGAGWFYWIAGMSLINTIAAFAGGTWRFLIGLGITQVVDAILTEMVKDGGNLARAVALIFDLMIAGIFIVFGVFAGKRHTWAFLTGMILFALDTVIFLFAQDWIGVAFHVYATYCIFTGFKATRTLNNLPPQPPLPPPVSVAEPIV